MAALVRAGAMAMIGVGAGLLRRAREEQHLRHRDARAAEDHRQPPVHLLQHGVQVADALLLAQKIELADHHRPDDAVLAAAAAEVRRCAAGSAVWIS